MNRILTVLLCFVVFCSVAWGYCGDGDVCGEEVVEPAVSYYETRGGVTKQFFPDGDIPLVSDVDNMEPLTQKMTDFWVDYDSNIISVAWADTTIGPRCFGATLLLFADVNPIMGPDWKDHLPVSASEIKCETFYDVLEKELFKE